MSKNKPEKSEKWVQKTQKVTINYFSRRKIREKCMNMMDNYAMIRSIKLPVYKYCMNV